MTPYQRRPGPLTVRLAEDMRIRNLSPRTIDAYTFHAERFADFIQNRLTSQPLKTLGTSSFT